MSGIECCILDVGQGSCNIISLGNGRAIIIDAGPSGTPGPMQFLKLYGIAKLEALVISHNHQDHDGGAARIFAAFPKAIKRVYFLQDGPVESIRMRGIANAERTKGNLLNAPERLEAGSDPRIIFPRPDDAEAGDDVLFADLSLRLFYPQFIDSLDAGAGAAGDRPNRSSAVLGLLYGERSILFPGDADANTWARLNERLGSPIPCDVMVAPHHGAEIGGSLGPKFFVDIVQPKHVVISVGTNNMYGHPHAKTVALARQSGATVQCTQITHACCDDLEAFRLGVTVPGPFCDSTKTTSLTIGGKTKKTACAASVFVTMDQNGVTIQGLQDHQAAVDRLRYSPDGHALCRATSLNAPINR